jgi:pentatricopeptide repeat protein
MITQTRTASAQYTALLDHYVRERRTEAAIRLVEAFEKACDRIESQVGVGKPYPATYSSVARWGYRWIKVHRYWIGYSIPAGGHPVITNIHFDQSDIPNRVAAEDDEAPI